MWTLGAWQEFVGLDPGWWGRREEVKAHRQVQGQITKALNATLSC